MTEKELELEILDYKLLLFALSDGDECKSICAEVKDLLKAAMRLASYDPKVKLDGLTSHVLVLGVGACERGVSSDSYNIENAPVICRALDSAYELLLKANYCDVETVSS